MTGKNIIVIGALSTDVINFVFKNPAPGESVVADRRHKELGGHGANTAISIYRASRHKPEGDGNTSKNDKDVDVGVQLIAGAPNEHVLDQFRKKLVPNGISVDRVEILVNLDGDDELDPDYRTATMESESGRPATICGFDTSNQWTLEHFDEVDKICGNTRPDLVIVTMELKKNIIERIIDTLHSAGIDILLYASPGETISIQHYGKLKHLICNDNDAARMLGLHMENLNPDTYAEHCEKFTKRGVENVVMKLGADGAYFKRKDGEGGFVSGYKIERDIIDQTGATTAFVGPYAVTYVSDKINWNLEAATELGNKASALFAIDAGYESAIPWSDEISAENFQPLHENLESLKAIKEAPARKLRKRGPKVRPNRGTTIP